MSLISRREFTRQLLTASSLSFAEVCAQENRPDRPEEFVRSVPDSIAGYLLTADDKQLVTRYFVDQERKLLLLRCIALPYELQPAFSFFSPSMNGLYGVQDGN